jgi:hypothetical protein
MRPGTSYTENELGNPPKKEPIKVGFLELLRKLFRKLLITF